jgi:hypothetical protein
MLIAALGAGDVGNIERHADEGGEDGYRQAGGNGLARPRQFAVAAARWRSPPPVRMNEARSYASCAGSSRPTGAALRRRPTWRQSPPCMLVMIGVCPGGTEEPGSLEDVSTQPPEGRASMVRGCAARGRRTARRQHLVAGEDRHPPVGGSLPTGRQEVPIPPMSPSIGVPIMSGGGLTRVSRVNEGRSRTAGATHRRSSGGDQTAIRRAMWKAITGRRPRDRGTQPPAESRLAALPTEQQEARRAA